MSTLAIIGFEVINKPNQVDGVNSRLYVTSERKYKANILFNERISGAADAPTRMHVVGGQ